MINVVRGFVGLFLLTSGTQAQVAQVVTVCGASKGISAIAERLEQPRLEEDGIAAGSATVMRTPTFGEYDIVINDAVNRFSLREDGAIVTVAPGATDRGFTIVAVYPLGTVETYSLRLDANGNGHLIWVALRTSNAGRRGSVFTAICRRS